MIFVGDDWAEDHHDVHLMDETGARLAWRRLPEGLAGIGEFHQLPPDTSQTRLGRWCGIETDRRSRVEALVAAGYQVYAINPLAAARYRDRHHVSGAKSDAGDAKLLADLVRADRHNHRLIAGDSADAEAVRCWLGPSESDLTRNRHTNALRSALREYYPGALEAFDDLHDRDALAVLRRAPTPVQAANLVCRRFGLRSKPLGDNATSTPEPRTFRPLCAPNSSPHPLLSPPIPATTRATVGIIAELNRQITDLEADLATNFEAHPDADIYRSLPGLGVILGSRVLGESRTTRTGAPPPNSPHPPESITVPPSPRQETRRSARHVRNRRLYDAIYQWAFCALNASPRARAFYTRAASRRPTPPSTTRAGNRLVGILHGCLRHRTHYNEPKACAHRQITPDTQPLEAYEPGMSSPTAGTTLTSPRKTTTDRDVAYTTALPSTEELPRSHSSPSPGRTHVVRRLVLQLSRRTEHATRLPRLSEHPHHEPDIHSVDVDAAGLSVAAASRTCSRGQPAPRSNSAADS